MDTLITIEPGTGGRFNYVITTASGYRAVMERCNRDLCAEGKLKPCARKINDEHMHSSGEGSGSVNSWLRHSATHCHGWHDARVEAFAAAVRRSYGSYRVPTTSARVAAALKGRSRPRMSIEQVADALDMTVEDYRAELAKAMA